MKKIYGIDSTQLQLTELASMAYINTDPIKIVEEYDALGENVVAYIISGCVEAICLTEKDVNDLLESLLTFKIKPEYLENFGPDASEESQLDTDDVKMLAKCWDMTVNEVVRQLTIE
jgi:hypothetical protein